MAIPDNPCYLIINYPGSKRSEQQIKHLIENGDLEDKKEALKMVINMTTRGESTIGYLMPIIRYIIPIKDSYVKKLLLIYWEVVPKRGGGAGGLLEELFLVCHAFRQDLEHPNEYLRGATLRLLSKLKEPELLEPLIPSVKACLKHRVAYVRRNALLAILAIYKNFNYLIPDAPQLIEDFIQSEKKKSCIRNAFITLLHVNKEKALNYLLSSIDQVNTLDSTLQLVIIELIKKLCQTNAQERSLFIRCIYSLLNSKSPSVRYEAAGALTLLSKAPSSVKATVSTYVDLILKESTNTTKLIIMNRLASLKTISEKRILQNLLAEILQLMTKNQDNEVKTKVIHLSLYLMTEQNVNQIVTLLKKEASRELNKSTIYHDKYSKILLQSLHSACMKFPELTKEIIPNLLDFLQNSSHNVLSDVLYTLKEVVHKYGCIRTIVLKNLQTLFMRLQSGKAYSGALWILAEYTEDVSDIEYIIREIRKSLENTIFDHGPSSIRQALIDEKLNESFSDESEKKSFTIKMKEQSNSAISRSIISGDHLTVASTISSLTKLAMKHSCIKYTKSNQPAPHAEPILILATIYNVNKSMTANKLHAADLPLNETYIKILAYPDLMLYRYLIDEYKQATSLLMSTKIEPKSAINRVEKTSKVGVDEPIPILKYFSTENATIEQDQDLFASPEFVLDNKLKKVAQLTGFSDPIYSEAYILPMNERSILLDVIIVNQTLDTLENCTLELATLGDLTIEEKPQPVLIGPKGFSNLKAKITVSSTENGVIFGNIVYGISGTTEKSVIVLNDIRVEIIDYIVPGNWNDQKFREKWKEFEWENKVNVRTKLEELDAYLEHLTSITHMKCVTPRRALSGKSNYLTANLHAKSIFGEHVIANLSLEKKETADNFEDAITGHIRIRGKTQGIVISLGEIIVETQTKLI